MGRAVSAELVARGHLVRALARRQSVANLPAYAEPIVGDALEPSSFRHEVAPADTLVHLVGTPHPGPGKAAQFRAIDLPSVDAALSAARFAGVAHFVYVSVAQPAPVMKAYVEVRREAEARIRASGIAATILRPWYVLGPGHRWPYLLMPLYAIAERIPAQREQALRLGLVPLRQMVLALVAAVEQGPQGVRVLDVPAILAVH